MSGTSLLYYNDQIGKVNPRVLRMEYKITGANALSPVVPHSFATISAAAAITQATIDAQLNDSSEFLTAQFDATSLATDNVGGVIDMGGQVKTLTSVEFCLTSTAATFGATLVSRFVQASTTLTSTSTNTTEAAKGSSGNLAWKLYSSGLSSLTSGLLVVRLFWISK